MDEAKAATKQADDGCTVDWSWLQGVEIVGATSNLESLVLHLAGGETLTVQAALWKGTPFLAFRFPPGREPRPNG